ncbi:hypothetical protein C8Q79DRAFT_519325 [Trametes meyenii]|nr:hypothetical protein C8Q79DRAFT_519325 [Trametes meyenii]
MDVTGPVDWSALFPVNAPLTLGNYMLLSSICIFYYDYLLTLPTEIRVFWGTPLRLAGVFYFLIRYGFLVNITLVAIFTVHFTQTSGVVLTVERCRLFYDSTVIINFINFASVAAFVAARMFAIWGRNRLIAAIVFLLGIVNPSAVSMVLLFRLKTKLVPWPLWGCEGYIEPDDLALNTLAMRNLPIVTSTLSIVYELLCLLLTAKKTLWIYRFQRKTGNSSTLTSLLLRDGSLYFAVMTMLYIVNIVSGLIPQGPSNIQINTVFGRAFTPILTARFIAHLRGTEPGYDDRATLPPPSIRFRGTPTTRSLMSVGDPISFNADGERDDAFYSDYPMNMGTSGT